MNLRPKKGMILSFEVFSRNVKWLRDKPQDSFFGGRTNAFKLFHEGYAKYVDFTSLYPWVSFFKAFFFVYENSFILHCNWAYFIYRLQHIVFTRLNIPKLARGTLKTWIDILDTSTVKMFCLVHYTC